MNEPARTRSSTLEPARIPYGVDDTSVRGCLSTFSGRLPFPQIQEGQQMGRRLHCLSVFSGRLPNLLASLNLRGDLGLHCLSAFNGRP